MKHNALILSIAIAGAALVAAPAGAQVYGSVRFGPPAPIVERVPVAPGPGYAWRNGFWRWNGNRYVWAHGEYVRRPYGRAAWVPGHWVRRGPNWVWREGHWS